MRRFFLLLLVLALLLPALGTAEAMMKATDAIFARVQELLPGRATDALSIDELGEGRWISAVAQVSDHRYTEWYGMVYDAQAERMLGWDDLFTDGDAAAVRIAAIAQEAIYANAYAEHLEFEPVPRDNFAIEGGQLLIFYPPEQFSYFSGRSGSLAFYAYELEGLLHADGPLSIESAAAAPDALEAALAAGILPGFYAQWGIGAAEMSAADEALGLVDVPDIRGEYAVWRFEAPQMRGAALLSWAEEIAIDTAPIRGLYTERIDLAGLQMGIATPEDCRAALGAPDAEDDQTGVDDPYALMPGGLRLTWTEGAHALTLNFVDGVLHGLLLAQR